MNRLMMCASLLFAAWTGAAQGQTLAGYGPGKPAGGGFPDDFRGKVKYFGNHSGEIVVTRDSPDRKRGPSKDCPRPDKRCPERIGGSLEVELEFEGEVVNGTFIGTGGLRDSRLIGRREGAQCRLFDLADGSVWNGRCDAEGFAGTVKSVPNAAVQLEIAFETVGTRVRDYSEWRRRREEAIRLRQRYDWLASVVDGTAPVQTRFEAAIELDSYGWQFDRLVPNSIGNVQQTKPRKGLSEITADFELEGGGRGWARGQVEQDQISCIEFWNLPGACQPLQRPQPPEIPSEEPPADQQGSMIAPMRETRAGA